MGRFEPPHIFQRWPLDRVGNRLIWFGIVSQAYDHFLELESKLVCKRSKRWKQRFLLSLSDGIGCVVYM